MAKIKFTQKRIDDHACEAGRTQSFIWDSESPGLGLRTTANGDKAYVFQSRLGNQTIRVTIGSPKTWFLNAPKSNPELGAREEANRLQRLVNQGVDPRRDKAEKIAGERAKKAAESEAAQARKVREEQESIRFSEAWNEYVAEKQAGWSVHHFRDHVRVIQVGGDKRARGNQLKEPGVLSSFADLRLVEVTPEQIEAWAKGDAQKRPTQARLGLRLLNAFLKWCAKHKTYKNVIGSIVLDTGDARRALGKPKAKDDTLQKEQLPAWFAAVRQIGNPVISAYLQCLLLVGSRREELASLKWENVNFQWNTIQFDGRKSGGDRTIPMTPYVAHLLGSLPRRNDWVFSSNLSSTKRLVEPSIAHRKACQVAGLNVSLHGLRRSFASLCEWIEMPAGISAQIQGHAPQGVREQNYIRRPIDLLRQWHVKIEGWILVEAGIQFEPSMKKLRVIPKI